MGSENLTRVVAQDYRLTRTREGLRIEVLDYHAEPLLLTPALLREFGIRFGHPDAPPQPAGPPRGARPEPRSDNA